MAKPEADCRTEGKMTRSTRGVSCSHRNPKHERICVRLNDTTQRVMVRDESAHHGVVGRTRGQKLTDKLRRRKIPKQVGVTSFANRDPGLCRGAEVTLALRRSESDRMFASGQFHPKNLDRIGQKSPATGICGFRRFPGDARSHDTQT